MELQIDMEILHLFRRRTTYVAVLRPLYVEVEAHIEDLLNKDYPQIA